MTGTSTPDRDHVLQLLGGEVGVLRFTDMTCVSTGALGETRLDDLRFRTSAGDVIPAYFLRAAGGDAPAPAVLYCHAHGHRYEIGREELVDGRPALQVPYAPALAARGYSVLCLEMPCFGARAVPPEPALAKAHHWRGTTLFGRMLAELSAGLDFLTDEPAVDASRIATLGISMGGTHAWWLAALDGRICAAAHLCCFADMDCLIATGAHDGHGVYMTVPGLLAHCSTGALAGLIAPRPQLVAVGLEDDFTSPRCFEAGLRDLRAAYAARGAGDSLEVIAEERSGHVETPAMRAGVLDFLERHLGRHLE